MKLTELGFETADIPVRRAKGKEGEEGYKAAQYITVRGISLDDLLKLFRVHGPDMIKMFQSLTQKYKDEAEDIDMAKVILDFAEQAPDLVADILVLSMDTPVAERVAAFAVAKKLPIPVQLLAAEKIVTLTLEDHGGLGELFETVIRMFGGMNGLVDSLKDSKAGLLASGVPSASSKVLAS